MVDPDLADHPAIVVFAYASAFLPWSAVSATDFINARWKTVQTTLREGRIQLVLILLPSFYIVFYIYLQALSADYKEMSAAFAALFFSMLHLTRTLLGIAHVMEFRNWAIKSILAMECIGARYKFAGAPEKEGKEHARRVANQLLINDTLVDNSFANTESASGVVYAPPHQCHYTKKVAYPSTVQRVSKLVALSLVPFRYLFDRLAHALGLRKAPLPTLRIEPVNPVDVFLNWASAFAAQGLSEWISNFSVAESPEEKVEGDGSDVMESFLKKRDYFAGEVLASAALRVNGWKRGNLMLWNEWDRSGDIADGRVRKEELLRYVLKTGVGLPYGVPHEEALGKEGHVGYRGFANKLARTVASLPPSFGKGVSRFDVEMLEWFAVLLCIGSRMLEKRQEQEKEKGRNSKNWEEENDKSTSSEDSDDETGPHREELERADLAIESLETQLGFARGSLSRSAEPLKSIVMHMAFPMHCQDLLYISSTNRLFLEIGEFIDIWLALISGEQVEFLLSKDEIWMERCLGRNLGKIVASFITKTSNGKIGSSIGGGEHKALRQVHAELKMASMEFQFAKMKQRCWHLEQTLIFMGYDMEHVRSELAGWVDRTSKRQDGQWQPPIPFDTKLRSLVTRGVMIGNLSAGLVEELASNEPYTYLQRRSVHVQLIWEVRAALQQRLSESEGGPSCLVAMILCILAFPSLSVKIQLSPEYDRVSSRARSVSDGELPVAMFARGLGSHGTKRKPLQAYEAFIEPRCGPQNLYVRLRFQVAKGAVRTTVFLSRHYVTEDDVFHWSWWRDAFSGQLNGLVEWQQNHRYPTSEIRCTNGDINDGIHCITVKLRGTGDRLRVWCGWLPFRIKLSRAEVSSPGFLMEYQEGQETTLTYKSLLGGDEWTISVPRQKRVVVGYSVARRERLRHACDVIEEVIDENGIVATNIGGTNQNSEEDEAKQILMYANELIAEESGYLDRALFMLEIAAYELGSTDALRRSVEVFLTRKDSVRNLSDVVELIQRCAYSILISACEGNCNLASMHSISDKAVEIHSIQAMIMEDVTYGHDPVLIQKFTTWIDVMLSGNMNFDGYYWIARLRRSFVYSRNFDLLATLGEVSLWRNVERDGVNVVNPKVQTVQHIILNKSSTAWNILRVSLYERAAYEGGVARALFNLANIYRDGILGITPDINKAISLYQKGVNDHGFIPSMINLGLLLSNRSIPQYNASAAMHLYQRAIYEEANADAMFNLANLFQTGGEGVAADASSAVKLYTRAAGQGHTSSMVNLATLFYAGKHVAKDTEHAVALLKRAVEEGGNAVAMYNLAQIILSSPASPPPDASYVVSLLEAASQQGHVLAQICLGDMLRKGGEGVTKDASRALQLYSKAAGRDNEEAMFKLGNLLREGDEGVAQDLKKARALYEKLTAGGGKLAGRALASLQLVLLAEGLETR